jgi:hypothetical protein
VEVSEVTTKASRDALWRIFKAYWDLCCIDDESAAKGRVKRLENEIENAIEELVRIRVNAAKGQNK